MIRVFYLKQWAWSNRLLCVRCLVFDVQRWMLSIGRSVLDFNVEPRTSNVELQTSNDVSSLTSGRSWASRILRARKFMMEESSLFVPVFVGKLYGG